LRYDYGMSDLALSSGGTTATFGAHTQQFHYDIMWHATSSESRIRPYVGAGAGVKLYQGTGAQVAYQPLSNFALLTQQQDLTPLVSAAAGVKFQISSHVQLRLDVHDYLTPFPNKVITPNVGAKVGGWLQDIVPMIGISYTN
jgi:outer membrane protein W